MATKRTKGASAKKGAKQDVKRVKLVKDLIKVEQARETKYNTFFTLDYAGMKFYNMQLVEGKSDNVFISEPQNKGKDGKYYKQYWLNLDKETQDFIIDKVYSALGYEDDENVSGDDAEEEELPFA